MTYVCDIATGLAISNDPHLLVGLADHSHGGEIFVTVLACDDEVDSGVSIL